MAQMSQKKQLELAEMLRFACSGDLRFAFIDRLAQSAGYARTIGTVESDALLLVHIDVLSKGLGVTKRTIQKWIRDGLPIYRISVGNRAALYNVWDVVKWRIEKRAPIIDGSEDDPFLKGASSPALEQYRREKAREAKRNNETAEGKLIEVADVSIQLMEIGRVFKLQAEILERAHGQIVGDSIREMIDSAEKAWEKLKNVSTKK